MRSFKFWKAFFGVLLLLCMQWFALPLMAADKTESDGFEQMNGDKPQHHTAEQKKSSDDDWFADDSTAVSPAVSPQATQTESHAPVYPLVPVGSTTLGLYLLTWLLARFRKMKTATHRKIWNAVLLVTFLVSGVMGLVLVVQINYDVLGSFYSTFMWLHVDFGIVMAIVSLFHAFWHAKYYATYFKTKDKK